MENSPFLVCLIYKDSIKAFLVLRSLSVSTCYCLRVKNAPILYPSADDSAPIFGTKRQLQVAQRVHGLHQEAMSTAKRCS